jgi:predicted nucleic acid binding AN1-type Zn finger protein
MEGTSMMIEVYAKNCKHCGRRFESVESLPEDHKGPGDNKLRAMTLYAMHMAKHTEVKT